MANSRSSSSILILILFLHLSSSSAKHGSHGRSATFHRHHGSQISNPRLRQAYFALQAWKSSIHSDPQNFTTNWVGHNVCNYTGVYCAPLPHTTTVSVAGIDLNHGDIAGTLPEQLGLLSDLVLIHLNSNRFCGLIPKTLSNLTLLFELDLSNNRFVGSFPDVVLCLPSLRYLDLRYNEFEGQLPSSLFNKNFDAVFLNNNRFTSMIPPNFGRVSVSVLVFANNNFRGCLPPTIANLADNLEELLMINTSLVGCLPPELGFLYKLRVLDLSYNEIVGPIPYTIAGLAHLEQLNFGHNMLSGVVPEGVCVLPSLANFTFSYNFFCEEDEACGNLSSRHVAFDDRRNCLPEKPLQRSKKECEAVAEHPVDCYLLHCSNSGSVYGGGGGASVPLPSPPGHA